MLTENKQIKIVEMRLFGSVVDLGKDSPENKMPPGYRHRYTQAVTYVLEDGEELDAILRGLTKPKLATRVESTRKNIESGCMTAQQYDHGDGPYWSFTVHMHIGPR